MSVAVFLRRAWSLFSAYDITPTEGAEGPNPFAIWRVLHHFTLYAWPTRPPFHLTMYNFGFYHVYAGVLAVLGIDDDQILLVSRCLTLVFAALGAAIYYRLALTLNTTESRAPSSFDRVFIGCVTCAVWFGTNFIAWWPLAIRPDMASWFFATLGFWLYVRANRSDLLRFAVLSSCAFAAAWTFKQSTVLMLSGVFLHATLVRRNWRLCLALVGPLLSTVITSLVLGGSAYRFGLLRAPSIGRWSAEQMVEIFARICLQNALVWFAPLLLFWRWATARRRDPLFAIAPEELLLLLSFAVAFVLGLFALGRTGSNKNHIAEAYLLGSLISIRLIREIVHEGNLGTLGVGTLLALIPMEIFPAVQLVWPNRFGVTSLLATPEARQQRQALANFVRGAPKPVYIVDDVLSMPWFTNEPDDPSAVVIDSTWYSLAKGAHLIEGGGVERMIRQRHFKTVIFATGNTQILKDIPKSYACAPITGAPNNTSCGESFTAATSDLDSQSRGLFQLSSTRLGQDEPDQDQGQQRENGRRGQGRSPSKTRNERANCHG